MEEKVKNWIVHLDMDAFFASVEQMDFPEYRGKPVIIGGGRRGVVATCSYEARVFGVRSAMPIYIAQKLCPAAILVNGRRERYLEKSREIMDVLRSFSPLVEPASIDEAYIDATGLIEPFGGIESFLHEVQKKVLSKVGLTASLGAAPIKFLAKIASDLKKPAGISVIAHEKMQDFLYSLPIGRIPGVGKQTLPLLEALGVQKAGDMRRFPPEFWARRLGKIGSVLYDRATGIDDRAVVPHTDAKSESAENTFEYDTKDIEELSVWLLAQSERVGANLRKHNIKGRTVTLKIKYEDFTQHTRSRTLEKSTNATRTIYETAMLLLQEKPLQQMVRLIGVGVSQFGERPVQLTLLGKSEDMQEDKETAIDATFDLLRQRFGKNALMRGKLFQANKKC